MKRLGLSKTTILRWEKEGKIPAGRRDELGWRWWTEEEFEHIVKLSVSGFAKRAPEIIPVKLPPRSQEFLPKLSKERPVSPKAPRFNLPSFALPPFRVFLASSLLAALVFGAVMFDFVTHFENASFAAAERLQYSALYLRTLVPAKPSVQFSVRLPDDYFLALGQDLRYSLPEISAGLKDGILELRRLVANVEPPRFDRFDIGWSLSLNPDYLSQSGALLANLTGEAESFFYRVGRTLSRIFDENKQFVYSLFVSPSPDSTSDVGTSLTSDVEEKTPGVAPLPPRLAPALSSEAQFLRFEIDSLRKELEALQAAGVRLEGERVVERIFERTLAQLPSGDLDAKLASLNQTLREEILTVRRALDEKTQANFNAIALTQRINTLGPVSISSPTISTPTITGQVDSLTVRTLTVTGSCSGCGGGSSNTSGWTDDGTIVRLTDVGDLVGIGTTTPGSILSIQGVANFQAATSTLYTGLVAPGFSATSSGLTITGGNILLSSGATSTFNNGISLSTGCFLMPNGVCAGAAGGGGAVNSGTSNYLTYYSAGTTLDSSTYLFTDTANRFFGIGSSTPWGLLSVEATSTVGTNKPIFVVSDQGTSTPFLYVSGINGNIGIGTNTPSYLFSVAGHTLLGGNATATGLIYSLGSGTSTFAGGFQVDGALDINSSTATSTFANGIRLENGCFQLPSGSCAGSGASIGGAISGGTSGSVLFVDASANLAQDNANLFWDDTNDIFRVPNASTTRLSALSGITIGGTATTSLFGNTSTSTFAAGLALTGALDVNSTSATSTFANGIRLEGGGLTISTLGCSASTQLLQTDASGNVICGTDDNSGTPVGGANTFQYNNAGSFGGSPTLYNVTNLIGVATSSPWGLLSVEISKGTTTNDVPAFVVSGQGTSTPAFLVHANGNVGIGTANPANILDISAAQPTQSLTWTNTANYAALSFYENTTNVGQIQGIGSTFSNTSRRNAIEIENSLDNVGFIAFRTKTGSTFERMRITNAGNVGIGTTSPWAKLSVNNYSSGASAVPLFTVASSTGAGATSTAFIINSVGNVGIGTAGPEAKLQVNSAAGGDDGGIGIWATDAGAASSLSFRQNSEAMDAAIRWTQTGGISRFGFFLDNSAASDVDTNERVSILESGNVGIGTTSPWAKLSVNNYSSGASAVPLFTVASSTGSGATSTAFIINSRGQVGIGTANPQRTLDVYGSGGTAGGINGQANFFNTAAGAINVGGTIFLSGYADAAATNEIAFGAIRGAKENSTNDNTQGYLAFFTRPASSGNFNEQLRITSAGNVGIGTTSPWGRLSVAGNTVLDSNLITIASSSASRLTIDYRSAATSTIPNNTPFAWSIATSTTAAPIFRINTALNGSLATIATSTFLGGFTIDDGAFAYTSASGITSVDSLQAGPMAFDEDAGIVSWIDMPVATTSTSRISMSYSAQLDSVPVLTIYGESTSGGGVSTTTVGIGTTTPTWLLHLASTTPYFALSDIDAGLDRKHWLISNQSGSLRFGTSSDANPFATSTNFMLQAGGHAAVPKGAFCVDDDGTECLVNPVAGRLYSINATVLTDDVAELMRSGEKLEPGDIVVPDADFKNDYPKTYEQERRSRDLDTKLGLDEVGVKKSTQPYEATILGVVSTKPGITLGGFEPTEKDYEVTLTGRVPVKVSTQGGEIKVGDRITSSPIPGVGMKATSSGITLGIALEDFDGTGTSTEKILVFVNLGYSKLDSQIQGGEVVMDGEGESAFWGIDQSSGRIKFISPLDLNDFDIVNVRAISGSAGKWSIDSSGRLTAEEVHTKKLCLEEVCVTKEELKKLLELLPGGQASDVETTQTSDVEESPPPEPPTESETPLEPEPAPEPEASPLEEPPPASEPEPPPDSDTSTTTPAT